MVPEAGGSSSFGRRAFNEFVSFGAGWALMLDYIVTVAISAYFVPNYLSVFWPALKTFPYNSIGGIVTIVFLVALNVFGIKEAARLNIVLALLDLGTQILLMVIGVVLLLQPKLLIDQIQLGVAPTWSHLIYGISIGTIAYTGIETVSNMSEEAANPDRDVPEGHQLRAHRRPHRLPGHLADGALRDAGQAQRAAGRRQDREDRAGRGRRQERRGAQRPLRVQGRSAAGQRGPRRLRPGRAARRALGDDAGGAHHGGLRAGRAAVHEGLRLPARERLQGGPGRRHRALPADRSRLAQDHPPAVGRHPGRDHPAHRHQRGPHRRVAPGLLAGPAPAGAADPRARPPQATHPVRGDHRLRRRGLPPAAPAGQHDQPAGRPVRVRRHDLVHRRARLGGLAAPQGAGLPASLPHADQHPGRQDVGARPRRHRRPRHLHRVVRGRRHAPLRPDHRLHLDGCRACSCTSSTAKRRAIR